MYQYLTDVQKRRLFGACMTALILLSVFLAVTVINDLKENSYIGQNTTTTNTISVTGTGEVFAVPDIATFSFSVTSDAKQVSDAQNTASTKVNSVIDALKTLGVDEKDIQTTGYNSYPTYQYQNAVCPQPMIENAGTGVSQSAIYCPQGKQVLTGYEVSQTISVKIRKTADAGTILAKVGTLGVTDISGLTFTIDNIEAVQIQARDKAIADAKSKAEALSKSLGVDLSHIVNFSENANTPYSPEPMVMSASVSSASVTPQIPTGQNDITSNVTITYEVK